MLPMAAFCGSDRARHVGAGAAVMGGLAANRIHPPFTSVPLTESLNVD